jgi:hypothetical protein
VNLISLRAGSRPIGQQMRSFGAATQGSLPTEDAALVLLFGLIVSGQIRLRRVDGWREIPAILRERRQAAA